MKTEYTVHPQKVITGLRADIARIALRLRMARLVIGRYKKPLLCYRILKRLVARRREISGEKIRKMVCVDGSYHWDLYVPGSKSKALDQFFLGEANRAYASEKPSARFTNVLMCITKKCPLKCEHCYEWDALNGNDTLNPEDLKTILARIQEKGTAQVQITGGEAMTKTGMIETLLSSAKPGTEFWMFTSGYNLTPENARKLKKAGLTGVVISLDHYNPCLHNLFRGSSNAFEWAGDAVRNAIEAELVTALSLCVTPAFATEQHLLTYAELAKNMGVSFIQILEPRATGHYHGKDVGLNKEQLALLEDFYLKMNFSHRYREYPIICYHGHYQRKTGCFGAGNRSLYIDTDGDIHACPFCRMKMGNVLADDFDSSISALADAGCHQFEMEHCRIPERINQ